MAPRHDIVVAGASWGGLDATRQLLSALPADFAAAVLVVQHRGSDSRADGGYAGLLQRSSKLPVIEPEDRCAIRPGHVYIAPVGYHMLAEGDSIRLSVDERVRWSRPSVDVLFESAADAFGSRVIAVVLTGANDDGARGVEAVVAAGGHAIAQHPERAERPEMPRAAIATGQVQHVLELGEIGPCLVSLCADVPAGRGTRSVGRTAPRRSAGG